MQLWNGEKRGTRKDIFYFIGEGLYKLQQGKVRSPGYLCCVTDLYTFQDWRDKNIHPRVGI